MTGTFGNGASGASPPRKRPDFALMFPTNKPRIVPPATRPAKRTHVGSPMRVRFPVATHDAARRLRDRLAKKPTMKPRPERAKRRTT